MNNLLKVVLGIGVLLFLYFGIAMMYKSCNSADPLDESSLIVTGDEQEVNIFGAEDAVTEVATDDAGGNSSGIDYSGIDEELEKPLTEAEKPIASSAKTSPTRQPASKPAARPAPQTTAPTSTPVRTTSRTSDDGSGKYMVVAGSYLVEANAAKMVQRLRDKGYQQAEIVQFDGNKYHTVVAIRSNDYDLATGKSTALKSSGIDCYVHTRQ